MSEKDTPNQFAPTAMSFRKKLTFIANILRCPDRSSSLTHNLTASHATTQTLSVQLPFGLMYLYTIIQLLMTIKCYEN